MEKEFPIYIPEEYVDEINTIIRLGIKHAKIKTEKKRNLTSWWDAEEEFLNEERNKK